MDAIADLFWGKLADYSMAPGDSQYADAQRRFEESGEYLAGALEGENWERLRTLRDAADELCGAGAETSFINGFVLGARLILDAFVLHTDES